MASNLLLTFAPGRKNRFALQPIAHAQQPARNRIRKECRRGAHLSHAFNRYHCLSWISVRRKPDD